MNMTLNSILRQKNMTMYRLAKASSVPYTTVSDICSGKTRIEKCSAETLYRLARALDLTMEAMVADQLIPRCGFELFKSNVCHRLKEMGDLPFLEETLEQDEIRTFYDRGWYPESLYLLAIVDYLSRVNGIPLVSDYDELRSIRLDAPIYPAGILAMDAVTGSDDARQQAVAEAIPEFRRFNIIESEVRNVL